MGTKRRRSSRRRRRTRRTKKEKARKGMWKMMLVRGMAEAVLSQTHAYRHTQNGS
jgi:hypothetical protein